MSHVLAAVSLSAQNSEHVPTPVVMQAAQAAFPQELERAGESTSRNSMTCVAVFSRDANGAPDLIAAGYSEGRAGVAMLRYGSGTVKIVDLVKDQHLWLAGGPYEASVVNLADPSQPGSLLATTAEISFAGQDWYFTWDGKGLHNITALNYEFGPWKSWRPRRPLKQASSFLQEHPS
jgi:hypothetical protein